MEIIKAEDYGLENSKANELTSGLKTVKAERELLIKEFEEVSKLEITEQNLHKFRELRLKIVKNRTQGIDKWHKSNKEFFLTGGKFVDAIKNKERAINEQMEEKLMDAEKYFENLEKERIAKIQAERVSLLSEFVEDASERDLSSMDDDVWESYLSTKKQAHLDKIQAELLAEKERIAKIQAEKEEKNRIRKENEKLRAEAQERERLAKIELEERLKKEAELRAKQEAEKKQREEAERKLQEEYEKRIRAEKEEKEKIEAELRAKQEAEKKQREEAERKLQEELNKDDESKVKDLIKDFQILKTKYIFKSSRKKKMYEDVGLLIDKLIKDIIN